MDCGVCQSQDTTRKTGIAKSGKNIGKPWVAYDCNEPNCKQPNGYPSRTFAPTPKNAPGAFKTQNKGIVAGGSNPISTIEAKVDKILAILKANFPPVEVAEPEEEHGQNEIPF